MVWVFIVYLLRAHPRSRGENVATIRSYMRKGGSSPLTRGKPSRRASPSPRRRLIPAHAGKTGTPSPPTSQRSAHPRSRGENSEGSSSTFTPEGSSPLTRGKPVPAAYDGGDARLIPAHAGKTRPKDDAGIQGAAHSRSRGENVRLPPSMATASGSSPLTRGKLQTPPACKSRGGSSPLTRGKPAALVSLGDVARLIPAHAGKTTWLLPRGQRARAHPRSRGENTDDELAAGAAGGSSPLTRGKPPSTGGHRLGVGLIPAHAGKTGGGVYAHPCYAAHPRSRGENEPAGYPHAYRGGSSPLTRGKPVVVK